MSDSMKFGPEWLRNMSADSPNSGHNICNIGGTSSTNSFGLNNAVITSSSGSSQTSSSSSSTPRNMFPEFRYGREEMLSLFDQNCNIPEILPSYKMIFVGKPQMPLALTPSTEEETTTQTPSVPSPRAAWIQRSPVGFNGPSRGTSRGGSVERGRIRGKATYHPIYQRPTAVFEEDLRSPSLKTDRSWSERNGAGDAPGNIGLAAEWNGSPVTSPRKEFPSHSRNMENWRRNRNDDGSSDTPNAGALTTPEGWRGGPGVGGTGFGPNNRWGRSTSWREEDSSHCNSDGGYSTNGVVMQRSYSTIASGDRGTFTSLTKSSQSSTRMATVGITNSSNQSSRNNQWLNGSGYSVSNTAIDGEDNLPEWAMENPSNGGGTFDATGAFHGSVEEEETTGNKKELDNIAKRRKSNSSDEGITSSIEPANRKIETVIHTETEIVTITTESTELNNDQTRTKDRITELSNSNENSESTESPNSDLEEGELNKNTGPSDTISAEVKSTAAGVAIGLDAAYLDNNEKRSNVDEKTAVGHDISDLMKEVADNMVEKLIMDDDAVDTSTTNTNSVTDTKAVSVSTVSSGMNVPAQNSFVSPAVAALLKRSAQQQQQVVQHGVAVSPPITSLGPNSHKSVPLYGGGVVVDHTIMQHHHIQQQQLSAAAAVVGLPHNLTTSNDFWFYRDPQSKVQGPFSAVEMSEWYRAGYFNENLFVRRVCDTRFRALGDLIKICHGNMPFTHSHMIPLDLESVHPAGNMSPHTQLHEKAPVLNEFVLKQPNDRRAEDLKSTGATGHEGLSSSVKNLMGSVNNFHMLNIHYQMLKEQYVQHQEMMVIAELSKNECFQRLSQTERENLVRQKVQMLGLPEHLASLAGYSNSIGNPNVTNNQLYDIIAENSKNVFSATQLQPSIINAFPTSDDFLLNAQQPPQLTQYPGSSYGTVLGGNTDNGSNGKILRSSDEGDLMNEFNLRMFLRGGNSNQQHAQPQKAHDFIGNATPTDFIAEQQIIAAAASHSPIMQMWMPQMSGSSGNPPPQTTLLPQQQGQNNSNQWVDGPLVGIPSAVMSSTQMKIGNIGHNKVMPTSLWAEMQHATNAALQHNIATVGFDDESTQAMLQQLQLQDTETGKQLQQQQPLSNELCMESLSQGPNKQQHLNTSDIILQSPTGAPSTNKIQERKDEQIEKQIVGSKQNNKSLQVVTSKTKIDNGNNRKQEEERRREQAEEKRRQKEERKRQQFEEERRRLQQAEEEKRRQLQEEKERQQQIQAQRRKAMLGTSAIATGSGVNANSANSIVGGNISNSSIGTKSNKSSVAPWSTKNTAGASANSPCLAEIQKAERRERRADQQRQTEMLEKLMRANAAAALESAESLQKWNALPVTVKSITEIQAEEAKRLANEQLEMQRRKELEQQQAAFAAANLGGVNSTSGGSNMAIWATSKAWTTGNTMVNTTASGFWEEPIKYSAAVSANNSNTTVASIVAAGLGNVNAKHSHQGNPITKPLATSSTASISAGSRNLKKSQTVSVMQNTASSTGKQVKMNNAPQQNNIQGAKPQTKPVKDVEKKTNPKINNASGTTSGGNGAIKKDDLENEFTSWCTKSLSNMNSKVDVPTFVTFLRDLESPYEVKDYIRVYLGDAKENVEFAKQFLERRSQYKNLQRAQNAHNDDMCKPAPAITPSGNDNADNKGKQKKLKKSKMTKLDARILGFSVTAAEGRINVGDRDYVEAP